MNQALWKRRLGAFTWSFLIFGIATYLVISMWTRSSASSSSNMLTSMRGGSITTELDASGDVDLETAMRFVRGGDPDF